MMGYEQIILVPILAPLAGAFVILLLRSRRIWQAVTALLVMLLSLVSSFWLLIQIWKSGDAVVYQLGGWPSPVGISLVADPLSAIMVFMTQLVLVTGIVYAMEAKDKNIQYPTFYTLFLCLGVGLTGAFLSGDLFNLFVFADLLVFY